MDVGLHAMPGKKLLQLIAARTAYDVLMPNGVSRHAAYRGLSDKGIGDGILVSHRTGKSFLRFMCAVIKLHG